MVREALAALQREGLVARVQGMGTSVATHKTRHALHAGGLFAAIGPLESVETRVISYSDSYLSSTPAARLGLAPGSPCLVVNTATTIDAEPMIVTTSILPPAPWQDALLSILATRRWRGGWYEALQRAGMGDYERELVMEASLADELVAGDLEVEVGSAVMFIERRLLSHEGVPYEYGFAHCRGNRLYYAYHEVGRSAQDSAQ